MDRAGLAVALGAVQMGASYGTRVIVLCGPGNNGGDGYVAARYLARRGVAVEVQALADPKSDAAVWALRTALAEGVTVRSLAEPVTADLCVDALFGAGFRGALPEAAAAWTLTETPVLAVDVPSGLDGATGETSGPAFRAARTVTFQTLKVGHLLGEGPERCGRIDVADIGLPGGEGDFLLCEANDAPRPARSRLAHKWSAGSVLVVGGSRGLTGATLLAARAALSGGAGAVTIACPMLLQPVYAGMAAEIMTAGIGHGDRFDASGAAKVLEAAARYDVLALGPGLGSGQRGFVDGVLTGWDGPLVVDADGINAMSGALSLERRTAPTVITPHLGEFERLTGRKASYRAAYEFAAATGTVVLLKGAPTFVAAEQLWAVTSGGPELATIGTGDVLTGLLSALWARGLEPDTAARSAAYWHGRAGAHVARSGTLTADLLAREVGRFAW